MNCSLGRRRSGGGGRGMRWGPWLRDCRMRIVGMWDVGCVGYGDKTMVVRI